MPLYPANPVFGGTVTATRFIGPATGLRETGGPTDLTLGAVATQQKLKRSGTTVHGVDEFKFGLSADSSAITTTLTDAMTTTMQAGGRTYVFEFLLFLVNSTATANVVTLNLDFDNTVTRMAYDMQIQYAAGSSSWGAFVADNQSITASPDTTDVYVARIRGTIVPGASGTLHAKLSRATSGNVIVKAGSYLVSSET